MGLFLKIMLQVLTVGVALIAANLDYFSSDKRTNKFKNWRKAFITAVLLLLLISIGVTIKDHYDSINQTRTLTSYYKNQIALLDRNFQSIDSVTKQNNLNIELTNSAIRRADSIIKRTEDLALMAESKLVSLDQKTTALKFPIEDKFRISLGIRLESVNATSLIAKLNDIWLKHVPDRPDFFLKGSMISIVPQSRDTYLKYFYGDVPNSLEREIDAYQDMSKLLLTEFQRWKIELHLIDPKFHSVTFLQEVDYNTIADKSTFINSRDGVIYLSDSYPLFEPSFHISFKQPLEYIDISIRNLPLILTRQSFKSLAEMTTLTDGFFNVSSNSEIVNSSELGNIYFLLYYENWTIFFIEQENLYNVKEFIRKFDHTGFYLYQNDGFGFRIAEDKFFLPNRIN